MRWCTQKMMMKSTKNTSAKLLHVIVAKKKFSDMRFQVITREFNTFNFNQKIKTINSGLMLAKNDHATERCRATEQLLHNLGPLTADELVGGFPC